MLATDRRHAEDQPRRPVPSRGPGDHGAERRRDPALHDRAGDGDAANGEQFFEMELQADAEHQQDDADFGQLLGERRVGDEARGVRPDERTGQQVAHERGQANSLGDVSQEQRRGEPAGEREDQVVVVQGVSVIGRCRDSILAEASRPKSWAWWRFDRLKRPTAPAGWRAAPLVPR